MALLTIIMMSAMVSILFSSLVFGQSSTILKNSEKLREFQSTTTGYIRSVKTLTSTNPYGIAQLTDSYAAKIKSLFDRSPSLTFDCKAIDCINSPQSTNQLGTSGNLLQGAKTKFHDFRMLTLQFQKDVTLATGPSNPTNIIGQLVDIYAKNVKDIFNY
ncbi:MAG: hypothetical protein ACHQXG_11380 [Nitrososphaerales archaeon]